MAFGLRYVKGIEDDQAKALAKSLKEQEDGADAPSSAPPSSPRFARPAAPVVPAPPAPTLPARSRFARGPQTQAASVSTAAVQPTVTTAQVSTSHAPKAPTLQAPVVSSAAQQEPVRQSNDSNDVAQGARAFAPNATTPSTPVVRDSQPKGPQSLASSFSKNSKPKSSSFAPSTKYRYDFDEAEQPAVATGPTEFDRKALRARRLMQEIAEFKRWDPEQTMKAERDAMRDPDAMVKEWMPVYQQELRPFRKEGVRSLEEGKKKHPNDVVFLLMKKGQQRLRVVPKEEAGAQVLLDGATLESLPATSTRFAPPSVLIKEPAPQPDPAKPATPKL